jgi:hypothetical protein
MVALTRDFHVVASCVAARVSAVLFPPRYVAQTRYVCALSGFLICHCRFSFSLHLIACSSPNLPVAANTMLFQGLCDQQTENMKRPRCRQEDSDVGISTPSHLRVSSVRWISARCGPGALPHCPRRFASDGTPTAINLEKTDIRSLFQIGLDNDETAH